IGAGAERPGEVSRREGALGRGRPRGFELRRARSRSARVPGRRRQRRPPRPEPRAAGWVRGARAGHAPARDGRQPRAVRAPPSLPQDPGARALRARRAARAGPRPGRGGGRLPGEALQLRRAGRTHPRARTASGGGRRARAPDRRPADGPADAPRRAGRSNDLPDAEGVRAAGVPPEAARHGPHPGHDRGAGLEPAHRLGQQRDRRLHPLPAREDRHGVGDEADPHRARHRLRALGTAPVKTPSIRWKFALSTIALVAVAVLLLLLLHHQQSRDRLVRQLERTLATKCEEVHSVLANGATRESLQRFVAVETAYVSSPYEYFYEFVDAGGAVLLSSANLGGARLERPGSELDEDSHTLPHPLKAGEFVCVRREPLEAGITGWNEPRVAVAVSLAPLESMLADDFGQSLLLACGGLVALFATLWVVLGRTLRRVATITRRASAITSTNLRERLPMNGSGDELDELSRVFNGMLEGLERALQQMEAFTSDAAHQLRTPLARVRGELDLILRDGICLPVAARGRLEEVREEVERLTHTCSRLLLLARLDRGALEVELLADDVDLGSLVEDLAEQVGPLADDHGVHVRCVVED